MSIRHFCDGCKAEVTKENRLFRSTQISHHFPLTEIDFTFDFTYGSNASGNRWVNGDGDICKSCFHDALRAYLDEVAQAEIEALDLERDQEAEDTEDEDEDYDDYGCSDGEDNFPDAEDEGEE